MTMKILVAFTANLLWASTDAFHAHPVAWISRPFTQQQRVRVLKAGEDEYGDLMSKLESSMGSVGAAVTSAPAKVSPPPPPPPAEAVATSLPKLELPSAADIPKPEVPAVELPNADVELPNVELPSVSIPDVSLPSVELPSIELPSVGDFDFGSLAGGGDLLPIAVGAIAVLAVVAAVAGGGGGGGETTPSAASASSSTSSTSGGETTPSAASASSSTSSTSGDSIDVSIPYDAAARLAYEKAGRPGDYAAFKQKYEDDAIAMVKAKQKK